MKLDMNVVRNLLIWLENNLYLSYTDDIAWFSRLSYEDAANDLNIAPEIIIYTSARLKEAGFIEAVIDGPDGGLSICDYITLTYEGHDYLNSIKDDSIWTKITSKIGSDVAAVTFETLKNIGQALLEQKLQCLLFGK